MPDMIFVESSNVEQIGYDEISSELHVIFKESGGHYVYLNVPQHVYEDFKNATSIGSFLNREIKKTYQVEKR